MGNELLIQVGNVLQLVMVRSHRQLVVNIVISGAPRYETHPVLVASSNDVTE